MGVKKLKFSIPLFVGLFIVLLQGFYLYVGLTTPGGKMYSALLGEHANFPFWLSAFVAKCATLLLKLAGYAAFQKSAINVAVANSGVNIAWGCLGVGAISLWTAFIAAHRCSLQYKLKWILPGVVLIFIINIIRVALIALSGYHNWAYIRHFNAHSSFNTITYGIIVLLMVFFVRAYNRLTGQPAVPTAQRPSL